jgi:hypothetical protein
LHIFIEPDLCCCLPDTGSYVEPSWHKSLLGQFKYRIVPEFYRRRLVLRLRIAMN